MSTALITGASSGIGRCLAREHAPGDCILIARREPELLALAEELTSLGSTCHVLAMDLSTPTAADDVKAWLDAKGLEVDVLINNAGFGGHGAFVDRPLEKDLQMIQLNVATLVALTHHLTPAMVARGHGRILNVGSTAGFLPGPLQATYYATKAFVNSFSQALHEELRDTGVTCTVLCPGPVDTEFVQVAGMEGVSAFKSPMVWSAEKTAKKGYAAMAKGRSMVVTPRSAGFVLRKVAPLLPKNLLIKASRKAMEK